MTIENLLCSTKSIYNLAAFYAQDGKLAEAEKMYLIALQGYEQVLGFHHTETLDTAVIAGRPCEQQGNLVQAEKLFLQALHGCDQILGFEHESTLDIATSLALVYQH